VLGRRMVTATGIAMLALATAAAFAAPAATATSAATAASARASSPTGPATANLITALIVNGSSTVTPLHETGTTSPAIGVGGSLEAAFTPNGRTAYVIGGDVVTPIAITDGVVASAQPAITLPHRSHGHADGVAIAVTPNGKIALAVNNFAPYWVTWINTATNTVTAKVKVGISPIEIAITPNGKYAYVTNAEAGTVTPIVIATHKALRAIKVGFSPEAIAITPNGKYAYVANNLSNTVSPIRIAGNKALRPIKVGGFPAAIAITPNGKYAYVTNNGSRSVSQISIASRKVVATIRVASFPDNIVITPNGRYAYVASFNGQAIDTHLHTVTVIRLSTGHVLAHITVGNGPIALGFSNLTQTVYVANFYADSVTPIRVSTNTAGPAIGLAGQHEPTFIAIDPQP